jgi:hypothetical protein
MSAQKKKGLGLKKMGSKERSFGDTQPVGELGDDGNLGEDATLVVDADGHVSEVPSPKKVPAKSYRTPPPKLTRGKRTSGMGKNTFLIQAH